MRAYTSVWRIRFLQGLQYRGAAFAGIATQLFFGLVFIMIYIAFYNHSSADVALNLQEVVNYLWLQQMFLSLIMLWVRDPELFGLITSGNIAYELARPTSLYPFWFSKLVAQRVANATMRSLPLLIIVFILPEPYRMTLSPSLITFVSFIVTLLLALFLVVTISMLIYISVFWTMSPVGSILMIAVLGEFFAGLIIPIPLMPSWMQAVTYLLPFRFTVDFPFRVYSGHIEGFDVLIGIGLQLFWIALLVRLGVMLMRRALRNVVVQGG